MKKKIIALCLTAIMATAAVIPATAATSRSAVINVAYGIVLRFNDKVTKLTDVNGNEVEPFVYNGTTYVPIRAVSELFKADVQYDSTTKTAYVYNDFAEICAVVYEMSSIMNNADSLLRSEIQAAILKDFQDYSEWYETCRDRINNMFDVLEIINDNVNYDSAFRDVSQKFCEYTVAFAKTNAAYYVLKNSRSSSDANYLADCYGEASDNFITASVAFDSYFHAYCLYRDLGF